MAESGERTCAAGACARPVTVSCGYVDRNGAVCLTAWCESHIVHFAGLPYCRRHADTLAGITTAYGSAPAPVVSDRSASLLQWIATEIEPQVREVFERHRDAFGEDLIEDDVATSVDVSEGVHEWQRAWGLRKADVYVTTASIGVRDDRDGEVTVRINGEIVATAVPPWVERHRNGSQADPLTERRERRGYAEWLVATIERGLDSVRPPQHPATV